jgi:hypothetical protein
VADGLALAGQPDEVADELPGVGLATAHDPSTGFIYANEFNAARVCSAFGAARISSKAARACE